MDISMSAAPLYYIYAQRWRRRLPYYAAPMSRCAAFTGSAKPRWRRRTISCSFHQAIEWRRHRRALSVIHAIFHAGRRLHSRRRRSASSPGATWASERGASRPSAAMLRRFQLRRAAFSFQAFWRVKKRFCARHDTPQLEPSVAD